MALLPKSQFDASQTRILTTKICEAAFLVLALAASSHAQQIASIDLAHAPVALADSDQNQKQNEFTQGCGKSVVGFADGVVANDDHEPRKIQIEFITVGDTRLVVGGNVEGTIRLQNVGTKPIQIPWSTDFRTTQNGPDPTVRAWEVGIYRVELKSEKNSNVELKSTSKVLFASKLVSGSTLTVRTGEWITAQISFKVEPREETYQQLTQGKFEPSVEWSQSARTSRVKDCGVTLGYYSYDGYYQQSNPPISVTVENESDDTTKEISKQPSN
jgi:hypothetical protein